MLNYLKSALSILLLCSVTQVAWADNFSLKMDSTDGKKHSLNEYIGHGKWTIVKIWSPQCPYCRHELPEVSDFHDAHADKDATVVGLTIHLPDYSKPNPKLLKQFADSYLVEFPLLLVDESIVYQVIDKPFHGVPVAFIYNPKGHYVTRIDGMVTQDSLEEVLANQDYLIR